MTHPELVEAAKRWLWRSCSVVITEMVSAGQEVADAIGFDGTMSIMGISESEDNKPVAIMAGKVPLRSIAEGCAA